MERGERREELYKAIFNATIICAIKELPDEATFGNIKKAALRYIPPSTTFGINTQKRSTLISVGRNGLS